MSTITAPTSLDNPEVATKINQWFVKKAFETRAFEQNGNYFLKARKHGVIRSVVGADRAIEVGIRTINETTEVCVNQGSWKTNIISNVAWFFVTSGANILISGWSVVLQKELESYIRSILGGASEAREVNLGVDIQAHQNSHLDEKIRARLEAEYAQKTPAQRKADEDSRKYYADFPRGVTLLTENLRERFWFLQEKFEKDR